MHRQLKTFISDEAGITAIEGALGAAILAVAAIAGIESFGDKSVLDYAAAAAGWISALFA